jgi:hypothetical protein
MAVRDRAAAGSMAGASEMPPEFAAAMARTGRMLAPGELSYAKKVWILDHVVTVESTQVKCATALIALRDLPLSSPFHCLRIQHEVAVRAHCACYNTQMAAYRAHILRMRDALSRLVICLLPWACCHKFDVLNSRSHVTISAALQLVRCQS